MRKLYPTRDNVVLEYEQCEKVDSMEGGIFVPANHQGTTHEHRVLAVGPLVETVKVGDTVLSDKYKGVETEIQHTKFIIIKEQELLAIV